MIVLPNTSSKLNATLDAAVTVDSQLNFVDRDATATPITNDPDCKNVLLTTATKVDVSGSPTGSKRRNILSATWRNKHATLPVGILISHTDGTTECEKHDCILNAQDSLILNEHGVFFTMEAASGAVKSQVLGSGPVVANLAADQSNSTVTPTAVAGITIPVGIGTYQFWYMIRYQAGATTTGVRYSVNHTGTLAFFLANLTFCSALSTASDANPDQDVVTATAGLINVMAARLKSTAGWGTTLSVDTANADMLAIIEGSFQVTAAGNLELWHGSEVAAASTTKLGTSLSLLRVA